MRYLVSRVVLPGLMALSALDAMAQWTRDESASIEALARAERASLVFVTSDLAAPVSLFGHTFVVFHQGLEPEPQSVVVEFGGVIVRAGDYLKALSSEIAGRFTKSDFAHKEREYFAEGRSLWIYPLQLDAPALARLKSRVATLAGEQARYTFMRWNCSHHVLDLVVQAGLLDREAPEYPAVVPIRTVRWLKERGLLGQPRFREAPGRRAQRQLARLDRQARERFRTRWLDPDQRPQARDLEPELASTLSAAGRHWVLREASPTRRSAWYRLVRDLPAETDTQVTEVDPSTATAGGTWTLTQDLRRDAASIGWRYGFLSLQDEDLGDLRNSELRFLDLVLARDDDRFVLTRADVFAMEANAPSDLLFEGFTQRLDLGYANDDALVGARSRRFSARFGRGVTWPVGPVTASVLPYAELGAFDDGGRVRPDGTVGLRLAAYVTMPRGWRARLTGDWHATALARVRSRHEFELSSASFRGGQSLGLRAEWRNGRHADALVGLRWSYRPD